MPSGDFFQGRPAWMNGVMVFCGFMTFIYMPYDFLLKHLPVPAFGLFERSIASAEEVWFGIMFHGWAAKLSEPLHWGLYALGFVGFRRMRSWMHPWAALYVFQISIGMLVWNVVYSPANPVLAWGAALISATLFAWLGVELWRARPLFRASPAADV